MIQHGTHGKVFAKTLTGIRPRIGGNTKIGKESNQGDNFKNPKAGRK